MRYLCLAIALLFFMHIGSQSTYAQCSSGKINGIYHTSCFPWISGDGTITGTTTLNDTPRLQRAIDAAYGKLVFNEGDYFIDGDLTLHSYIIIEGTGRTAAYTKPTPTPMPSPTPTPTNPGFPSSKIVQTVGEPIFRIGESVYGVSIRDIALTTYNSVSINDPIAGSIGVLAEGGNKKKELAPSSLYFQVVNVLFAGLDKGMYVNAIDSGEWQFDNITVTHSAFEHNNIGIHINSNNSGWSISNSSFIVPEGDKPNESEPLAAGRTYGIFMERGCYTVMDFLIGNGDYIANGPGTAFLYVIGHGGFSLRNSIDEGFYNSVYMAPGAGASLTHPVMFMNNTFQSKLIVDDATVVSTANQFFVDGAPALAKGDSQVYSYGDKFCYEGVMGGCPNSTYSTQDNAVVLTSVNQYKSTTAVPALFTDRISLTRDNYLEEPLLSIVPPSYAGNTLLRLGRGSYHFDVTRNESNGSLHFKGNQNDYSAYIFDTNNGGKVTINNDGSVTYGSVAFAALGAAYNSGTNGTVVYCSDCTKATPCAGSGSGAIAKRINGAWDCD